MTISIIEAQNIAKNYPQVKIETFRNDTVEIRNIHSYSWGGCEQYDLKEITAESLKTICDEFTINNKNKDHLLKIKEKLQLDLQSIIDILITGTQVSYKDTENLKSILTRNLANCGHIDLEESVTTAMEIKDIDIFLSSNEDKESPQAPVSGHI